MRFDGWTEIATHLGVSIRTAQRYRRHGLPIFAHRRRVWTTEDAIDGWISDCDEAYREWKLLRPEELH